MGEMRMIDEERYWRAVVDRDASMDGVFVYGVRSTGVYCKPNCPSRRAGREQVLFFVGPDEAEAGGFRACMRCHPKGRTELEPAVEIAERASRYIEERWEQGETDRITLEAL